MLQSVRAGRVPRARSDESGFTLVELIVAMFVITAVLLGLMALQTGAMVTTAQTRQRAQATAIGNQVMEQLRALPWLTLSKGVSATVAASDPNINSGRFRPAVGSTIDEVLVSSSSQVSTAVPLSGVGGTNISKDSDPSIPGVVFTSRVYTSRTTAAGADALTLTVITTWTANKSGKAKYVVLRSEAYAPAGGCGDATNQPFLGACQALLSANGTANGPAVQITPASVVAGPTVDPATTTLLPGDATSIAGFSLAQITTGVTSQQSTNVESAVLQAGSSLTTTDTTAAPIAGGGSKISNQASNDVGSSGAAPANPPDQSSTGAPASASVAPTKDLSMSLTAGGGVSGVARATTVAACYAGIAAGSPCASADATGGSDSTVVFNAKTTPLRLVTLTGGGTSKAFGGRFTTTGGATTVGCTALSGAGCVAGGSQRSVGTVTVGSVSWSGGKAPSGLMSVSGYADSVRVERGDAQHTAAATTSRTGAVQYWNGTGYSNLSLATTTSVSVSTGTVTWSQSGVDVSAKGSLVITPATSTLKNVDAVKCSGEGCSIDADTGTVTLSVTYTVTASGDTRAFTVSTTLGTSRANAAFKAAPSA